MPGHARIPQRAPLTPSRRGGSQACEKLRRVLSANSEGTISLDCLVGDTDVHGSLGRADLEAMAAPLVEQAVGACQRAVEGAAQGKGKKRRKPPPLDAIELVGGASPQ